MLTKYANIYPTCMPILTGITAALLGLVVGDNSEHLHGVGHVHGVGYGALVILLNLRLERGGVSTILSDGLGEVCPIERGVLAPARNGLGGNIDGGSGLLDRTGVDTLVAR